MLFAAKSLNGIANLKPKPLICHLVLLFHYSLALYYFVKAVILLALLPR